MDHFGIGGAILGAVRVYLHGARGTGRTTSLLESVGSGDRVVFQSTQESRRFKDLCSARGNGACALANLTQ